MYNLLNPLAPQGVFLQASVSVKFLIFRGSLNEKGEFIRAATTSRSVDSTAATEFKAHKDETLSRDDLFTLAKGIGALALLAGLIWFVAVFHEWVAIGLGLWVVSSIRAWLR